MKKLFLVMLIVACVLVSCIDSKKSKKNKASKWNKWKKYVKKAKTNETMLEREFTEICRKNTDGKLQVDDILLIHKVKGVMDECKTEFGRTAKKANSWEKEDGVTVVGDFCKKVLKSAHKATLESSLEKIEEPCEKFRIAVAGTM